MGTRLLIPLSLMLAGTLTASGIPARRAYFPYTQPDGTVISVMTVGDEYARYYLDTEGRAMTADPDGTLRHAGLTVGEVAARTAVRADSVRATRLRHSTAMPAISRADDTPPQYGMGLFTYAYPRTGEVRSLVFLVEFADKAFTMDDPNTFYSRQLNEEDFSENRAYGSARDYFIYQSDGEFLPHFDVCGPVVLPHETAYYGANDYAGNDRRPEQMVTDAAAILADEIDFSEYDLDGDGYVDNIYVIYAGYGENNGGSRDTVWPHSYQISRGPEYNGVRIYGYACSNEISDGEPDGIGTFCHEFSHVLGLPDLYSTSASLSCTPHDWDIMDSGSYNNDSRTPPNYSSFERNAVGWMRPMIAGGNAEVTLDALGESNSAILIPTARDEEFFLLENRQKTGWDEYLPGHGLLVWHIDFRKSVWDANTVNNSRSHQYVDIVEANGQTSTRRDVMAGYSFPGTSGNPALTATTEPALLAWDGTTTGYSVTGIAESDGTVTFSLSIDDDTNGIGSIDAADGITVSGRTVVCTGAGTAGIYRPDGTVAALLTGGAGAALSPGLYIVATDGTRSKIIIK